MRKSTARVTPITAAKKTLEVATLGPGLHVGQVESQVGKAWRVRMLDGTTVDAALGPAVVEALLHQCANDGRLVILADSGLGLVVLGALQTAPVLSPDADGVLNVQVRRLNVEANEAVALRTPNCAVELRKDGKTRLRSRRFPHSCQHVRTYTGANTRTLGISA